LSLLLCDSLLLSLLLLCDSLCFHCRQSLLLSLQLRLSPLFLFPSRDPICLGSLLLSLSDSFFLNPLSLGFLFSYSLGLFYHLKLVDSLFDLDLSIQFLLRKVFIVHKVECLLGFV